MSTEDEDKGGEVSQPFFRVELLAFSHRGAVPGGEAAGQPRPLPSARAKCELRGVEPLGSILTHTPVLWTNAEPGAQQSLLTAGLATPRRDRMRFAALRRCGAVEERDMRPRDACQTRSLGIGPFGGAGKGSTPLAAQRRATFSFGWVLSLRVPVAGQPRLVSPFIVSAPPSAAHAFGNPACLRGRAGDVGAGRRGLLSGMWEFEAAAPPVGGDPLCCRPGDNDSRRVPCSW